MSAHHCHAVGCSIAVPARLHMCPRHWAMVPKIVQELIWKHYRPGQEIDKRPSIDYIATAFVSISSVALKEGKSLPSLEPREDSVDSTERRSLLAGSAESSTEQATSTSKESSDQNSPSEAGN